jgi:hypothetical protein
LSRHFAMLMPSPLAMPAAEAGDEDEESRLQAGLASRILSGPGLRLDWLEEIDRRGLAGELLAEGIIDQAVATAPHGHQLDRGAEREDDPAVRPGRVPVPRRGLRRDLAHHLRHARPGPQARHPGPHRPGGFAGRPGTQRARSRLRTVGRPFSMRTSPGMVCEGRLRTSVRYIGAGGRLPLMWLLYSRAVRIPCGQGLGDGLVRS